MHSRTIKNTPILLGNRIYLRELNLADAACLLAATQIEELRYMTGLQKDFTLQEIQEHIRRCLADSTRYDFAICLQHTDQMIGELSILEIDQVQQHTEFRIALSNIELTGHGYGTEAIELVKDFVFHQLKLQSLGLEVFGHNPRAQRAYEKCGFQVVQINKDAFEYNGQYSDEIIMQIKNPKYITS